MQCSLADLDSIFTESHEMEEVQVQPTIVQPSKLHSHGGHRLPIANKKSHKSLSRQSTQSQQTYHVRKHTGQPAQAASFRQPAPPRQARQVRQQSSFEFRQPLPRPHAAHPAPARHAATASPFRQPLPPAQLRQAYAIQPLRHSVPMALIQQANYSRHSQQSQCSSAGQELPPSRPVHAPHAPHAAQPTHVLQPTHAIRSHQIQQSHAIQQLQQQVQHSLETQSQQSHSSQPEPSCSTSNVSQTQQAADVSPQPIQSMDDDDSQEFKFLNADEIFKGTVFDQLNSFDGEALDPFLEDDVTAASMSDDAGMSWEANNLFGDQDPDQPNVP